MPQNSLVFDFTHYFDPIYWVQAKNHDSHSWLDAAQFSWD